MNNDQSKNTSRGQNCSSCSTGQAVLIAAGESSRFWPLNGGHKSQINLLGESLIYWTIKGLSEAGIKDIIVVKSPNSSLEQQLSKKKEELGVNLSFVIQEDFTLGAGNAILQAKELINGPFFVFWPYRVDAGKTAEKMLELNRQGNEVVLTGTKTNCPWEYGIFKFENEKIVEIIEKPERGKEPSLIRAAGSYLLSKDFLDCCQRLEKHHRKDFIDALNICVKEKTAGFLMFEKLATLKYPWDLFGVFEVLRGLGRLKPFVSPSVSLEKNVVIEGDVFIGDNVSIGANTVIKGPCFIGEGCKIGANNVLRGPVNLEKNVKTGAFMELKNCIVQEGAHFHSGYAGDSIIGRNCRFGAGFITANKRVDRGNIKVLVKGEKIDTGLIALGAIIGDNVHSGIHSGTMPGVLMGKDCVVGPGTLVFENIEDNKLFYSEFKGTRKDRP